MATFDALVEEYTARASNGIPCVVLAAADASGKALYSKVCGFRTLGADATPVQSNSVFHLASSSKLITSIAALQCVDRGLITLDEPVYAYVPELEKQQIISFNKGDNKESEPFKYTPTTKEITLRQLLTHTSGVGYDIINPHLKAWRKSRGERPMAISGKVTESFSTPLIFEPGESWMYGAGLDCVGVLVGRLNGNISLEEYMVKNIFKPLNMTSATFFVKDKLGIQDRLVDVVTRSPEGNLLPSPNAHCRNPVEASGGGGLYSSVPDFMAILVDLLQDQPKLLRKETVEMLFWPQLADGTPAMKGFKAASMIYDTGLSALIRGLKVNHSLGGLLVQEDSKLGKTTGTMSWAGSTGTLWFVNRDRGVAAVYGSQMFPPGDVKNSELLEAFVKEVWRLVGKIESQRLQWMML